VCIESVAAAYDMQTMFMLQIIETLSLKLPNSGDSLQLKLYSILNRYTMTPVFSRCKTPDRIFLSQAVAATYSIDE